MSTGAGYSKTPLVKKLGIKSGMTMCILNAPDNYQEILGALPEDVIQIDDVQESLNFIHYFVVERADLEATFSKLKQALTKDGMLWISWYKKASKMPTDLTEDIIREIGLDNGLVDVKVAAIDHLWSGLKFVYRVKDR